MEGAARTELSSGDYRITPSEKMRNEYGVPVGDILTGDFEYEEHDVEEFHKYEVVRQDGTAVLDIFETHGSAEYDWLPFSVPQYVYQLVRSDGDPCLVVEVDHGWYPSYTIRDPQTAEPLGTVAKSKRVLGDWQLQIPDGTVRATAETTGTLRNLFSFATHRTYAVSGTSGDEVARFERVRAEGDFVDQFRSAMDVSCSPSSLSTEQCLAFAFALLYEGTKSSSGSTNGGGD